MGVYRCKHFEIYELIPEEIYSKRARICDIDNICSDAHRLLKRNGAFWREWLLFDRRLLMTIDKLREKFGVVTCNNWFHGGNNNNCGFRVKFGYGQHPRGRAFDLHFKQAELADVQQEIQLNRVKWKDISGIEIGKTITWLHIDTRNYDGLMVFDC